MGSGGARGGEKVEGGHDSRMLGVRLKAGWGGKSCGWCRKVVQISGLHDESREEEC